MYFWIVAAMLGISLSNADRAVTAVTESFRDCQDCPSMVSIPAGSFVMGGTAEEFEREGMTGTKSVSDEVPRHPVSVKGFSLSVTEVTRDQFEAFVRATRYKIGGPCGIPGIFPGPVESEAHHWRNPGFAQNGDHPVVCVNWNDAAAYTRWLSQKAGKTYRLPSEAEWEYAARAGTTTARYWSDSSADEICLAANTADVTARRALPKHIWVHAPCSDGHPYTAPIGRFRPNAFGLRDMLGNVWEWTQDCYNNSYTGAPADGSPWLKGNCDQRVTRGGSWFDDLAAIRAASRVNDGRTDRINFVGFRVARSN